MLDGLSNIQLPFIQHKQDHVIEGFLAQVSTKNKTIFPFLRLLSLNSLVSLVVQSLSTWQMGWGSIPILDAKQKNEARNEKELEWLRELNPR